MEMHEVPDPVIENDTDVLLKMSTVGVCGSDVHYYRIAGLAKCIEFLFNFSLQIIIEQDQDDTDYDKKHEESIQPESPTVFIFFFQCVVPPNDWARR